MSRRLSAVAVLLSALLPFVAFAAAPAVPTAVELRATVQALTTPEMAGRRSGTDGGDRAARQVAAWLGAAGLRPAGDAGTFLQWFVLGRARRLGPDNRLDAAGRRLAPGRDWTPHGGSRTGATAGRLVVAGYGVDAADDGWNDYAGLDARNAVVLALDGAPPGRRATRLEKLVAARRHGASALLVVADALPALDATAAPVDLFSGTVSSAGADALLAPSGRSIAQVERQLAGTRTPASFATATDVTLHVDLAHDGRRAANVIGILPGTDPALAGEAIVIGAHYDHIGVIGEVVHPGADDNGSGTSVVVGLARAFAAAGGAPRTLVFALFGGEELGLIGSSHYVSHPAVPLERTAAMLNFDMVGRLRDQRLRLGGVDSGTGLRAAAEAAVRASGIAADLRGSPSSPSDHSRFYAAGTPVLFFHTGAHEDYHRPGDTPDKLDADGMARVAAVGGDIVVRLAAGDRPKYAAVPSPGRRERRPPPAGTGTRAFLGVGGDLRDGSDGAPLSHVVPGSAAARAGLRDGDVIIRLGRDPVNSFEDLRTLIGTRRPGETVELVYLRDGRDHATSATLDRSQE